MTPDITLFIVFNSTLILHFLLLYTCSRMTERKWLSEQKFYFNHRSSVSAAISVSLFPPLQWKGSGQRTFGQWSKWQLWQDPDFTLCLLSTPGRPSHFNNVNMGQGQATENILCPGAQSLETRRTAEPHILSQRWIQSDLAFFFCSLMLLKPHHDWQKETPQTQ